MTTHTRTRFGIGAGSLLAVCLACSGPTERVVIDPDGEATPQANDVDATAVRGAPLAVADVMAAPERHVGHTITVLGDVDEVFGERVFTLDDENLLKGGIDNDLLVVGASTSALALDPAWGDAEVRVTGKLGARTLVEVEREVGWDLQPEIEAEVDGTRVVLVATAIERVVD